MATVIPTYSDVYWGPDAWCLMDYFQNPTRVTGGNPLLLWRHGAGWTAGHHQYLRNSVNDEWWHFFRCLLADHASIEPSEHWDICSFTSGQKKHGNAVVPRSQQVFAFDCIRDFQRAICSIKALNGVYGFDPKRVIVSGDSAGGMMAALSQLMPPRLGSGNSTVAIDGLYTPDSYDSVCRGILNFRGPIDLQSYSGTDYFHFSRIAPFLGVNEAVSTEWDGVSQRVKAALSVRQYFVSQDLATYPGMYLAFNKAGNGTKPLGNAAVSGSDPHDHVQLTDMLSAARTAGVDLAYSLLEPGARQVNPHYPSAPPQSVLNLWTPLSNWMRDQIKSPL